MKPAWTPLRILLAVLGAAALVAGGAGTYLVLQQKNGATRQGDSPLKFHPAPRSLAEVEFMDAQGKPRTLAEFRGRTVLLNVWATWCPPCREEMPSLDRLQQALGGSGFEVVALSIDAGGTAAVERFYKEIGIASLAIYVDPSMRVANGLATPGLPTTLLIDAQGRELGRHAGPAQWDSPEAMRAISPHVARP